MKTLLLTLCLIAPVAAYAASPEESYFAARDAANVKLGALSDVGASGPYDKAEKDLEQMIRPIVGPVTVKGFVGDGKLNLGSIVKGDEGYGTLDGLSFFSPDKNSELVVTTLPILRHWLVEHKDWSEGYAEDVPQTPELALKSTIFYNQAIVTDSAIIPFSELPITRPANASLAFAMLDGRTQDDTVSLAPDEIIVGVLTGERLFIAIVPARARFSAVPSCAKARQAADKKIEAADNAFIDSNRKNAALGEKARKLKTDADAAQAACFAGKVKTQKGFADAVAQAQDLANTIAGK